MKNQIKEFEEGKYYEHETGYAIHTLKQVGTIMYGNCIISEDKMGCLIPVGNGESHTIGWFEIDKEKFLDMSSGTWMF